jgi:hypothetical protein
MTEVNRETNRAWLERVKLVRELVAWVGSNLKEIPVKRWMKPRDVEQLRESKAAQYVYGYLCLGKMLFPEDNADPLFTDPKIRVYSDYQMFTQLKPGMYHKFVEEVSERFHSVQMGKYVEYATWHRVTNGLPRNCMTILARLQDELCDRHGFSRATLGKSQDDFVSQNMIGLVLRGQCIGAFDNNLHGSVKAGWQDIVSRVGEFTECFASPFNHKFDTYYSMFEEDRAFGSLGNFFTMVQRNRGVLPPGNYQMNPVFTNAVFERVADILKASIVNGHNLFCIVVTANWTDAPFYGQLKSLMEHDAYTEHSVAASKNVEFVHDMRQSRDVRDAAFSFTTDTAYWIFSTEELPDGLVNALFG